MNKTAAMNLTHLNFIKAVAEHGSFSRAAEACCVTQPTLSNAIAQVEDQVGDRLFRRTTRSVRLTRFGAHLLPLITAVLDARDDLLASARAFHEADRRLVRVGLSPLIDSTLVSGAIGPFTAARPGTEVFLKQCFLDDLEDRLDNETLDLALLPALPRSRDRRPRATARPFYSEPLFVLDAQTDAAPPRDRNAATLDDLDGQRVILTQGCGLSDVIADLFKAESKRLTPYPGQALSYAVVEEWAGLGLAAGILPRSKISPDNDGARPLVRADGTPALVNHDMVWRKAADGAVTDAFVAHLAETVPALLAGRGR
ncbi:MAG: LysR family transcriptional regulator [Rhodobacterales bacterium]|nr:LysR family transcriptional regulator [Rhodobacterales bacterium]